MWFKERPLLRYSTTSRAAPGNWSIRSLLSRGTGIGTGLSPKVRRGDASVRVSRWIQSHQKFALVCSKKFAWPFEAKLGAKMLGFVRQLPHDAADDRPRLAAVAGDGG